MNLDMQAESFSKLLLIILKIFLIKSMQVKNLTRHPQTKFIQGNQFNNLRNS